MKEFKRGERVFLKSDPKHHGTVSSVGKKYNTVRIKFDGERGTHSYYASAVKRLKDRSKLEKVLE